VTFERPRDADLPLRERKKVQTKRRIKSTALDLIGRSAYDDVTVEQIADRSGVSPSTVYRYFGTKEGIFLWDEYDEAVIEDFKRRVVGSNPVEAMTDAMAAIFTRSLDPDINRVALEYVTLIDSVPQLRQSLAIQIDEIRQAVTSAVVTAGWPLMESSVFAGAMVGMFVGALEAWVAEGATESLEAVLERATKAVTEGFSTMFDQRTAAGKVSLGSSSEPP
jgi:AcrR family transcriptional regulator